MGDKEAASGGFFFVNMAMDQIDDRPRIYLSSKRHHNQLWRNYRNRGYRIISSWIDLDGAADLETIGRVYWPLWLSEAGTADYTVFYAHPQDVNHAGCLMEITACLINGGTVLHVGVSDTMKTSNGELADFTYHPRWHRIADLDTAFKIAAHQSAIEEFVGAFR